MVIHRAITTKNTFPAKLINIKIKVIKILFYKGESYGDTRVLLFLIFYKKSTMIYVNCCPLPALLSIKMCNSPMEQQDSGPKTIVINIVAERPKQQRQAGKLHNLTKQDYSGGIQGLQTRF